MGITCRIHIRKSREGIHRAGEPLSGILSCAIDAPTEYQTAVLSLVATAKCSWTEYDNVSQCVHNYIGRDEFLTLHTNIFKKRPEQTITLDVGTHEYPFEFLLPAELPSSIHDEYCDIKYQVMVKFVKPIFFSFAERFQREVTVYGYVNSVTAAESRTYELHKKLFKWFSTVEPMIHLKARIAKSLLTPGENALIDVTMANNTNTNVYSITTELSCRTTYIGERYFQSKAKVVEEIIPGCAGATPPIPAYKTCRFSCTVPTPPHLYSIQHSKIINKEYFIKVNINLPFPHMTATCTVPIVIGESSSGDCSGIVEIEDDFELLEQTIGDNDKPPSYWEVMSEVKRTDDGSTSEYK